MSKLLVFDLFIHPICWVKMMYILYIEEQYVLRKIRESYFKIAKKKEKKKKLVLSSSCELFFSILALIFKVGSSHLLKVNSIDKPFKKYLLCRKSD